MAEIKVEPKQRGALPWILGLLVLALLLWVVSRMIGGRDEEIVPATPPAAEVGSLGSLGSQAPDPASGLLAPLEPRIVPAVNPYLACAGLGAEPGDAACTGLAPRHRLWA